METRVMKKFALFAGSALFITGAVMAQEVPRFAVSGGAGFTTGVGDTGTRLDTGWNVGGGIAFGSKWHGKFFAEARYNRISIGNYYTEYIPVTFGFRR